MSLIRTIRRYLGGILNSLRAEGGVSFGIAFETSVLVFGLRTLQVATDSFSKLNKIGEGGFGSVYKGVLPNGQVKKLSSYSTQGVRQFTNEVELLSEIRHMNLVILLGCCAKGPERMLVYEYLPNKSLDCFLFDKKQSSCLIWETRFRIATGVARGLLYLHEEAPMRILHGDIKASNILLDEKLSPKITDFGLAWMFPEEDTHVNTSTISGTLGYMAPEYSMYGDLSVKIDVFSYGILLLEIISGRKSIDFSFGPGRYDLLHSAWTLYQEGKMSELADPSLGNSYNTHEVEMCIQIALLCCQKSPDNWPDMNSIHVMLLSNLFALPAPGQPCLLVRTRIWTSTTTSCSTSLVTNLSTAEQYSQNSISVSSTDEGR
ncbi:unnamed protein product [Linum trigynum]|uniref:Protein kinase domain-containing protein n=1 Tax=Linum trigynum TaxID=586398 RepID=A0AAV2DBJ3_9ROSI